MTVEAPNPRPISTNQHEVQGYNFRIMQNALWLLAVAFAITQAPVNAPGQARDEQLNATHDAAKSNPVSASNSPIAEQPGTIAQTVAGEAREDRPKQQTSYWKEAFGPANLPNWALVIVGGIAGYLAWRTVRAVQLQAAAQMDSDRAWILVSVGTQSREPHAVLNAVMAGVFCEVAVVGNTPARILSEKYRYRVIPQVKGAAGLTPELEKVPVYLPENEVRNNPIFLAPGDKSPRHVQLEAPRDWGEAVATISLLQSVLCVYGRIEYEDAFKRHAVTQFCAIYYPRLGSVTLENHTEAKIGGFGIDGPEGYNYNT